ncbi:MAG: helix-turn-helix domain-containing protein [Pseudomonadales bacterium]
MASYSEDERVLRQLLKQLRLDQGMTQLDLAMRVGHSQHVISKIERGHRRLYATQLFDYVELGYGMSPTQFAKQYERARGARRRV